jgi:hypothetical protein
MVATAATIILCKTVTMRDSLVNVQAGLVEQAQIEENNVRQHGPDPLKPLGAGASHFDPVSGAGEHLEH